MRRVMVKLFLLVTAVAGAALGIAPGVAHAAPSPFCGTTSHSFYGGGEFPTKYWASYVGSATGGFINGPYRIWHVTEYNTGDYARAVAYRCDSAGAIVASKGLTQTTTASSTDLKCGTANFTVDDHSYTYVGSRTTDGFTYRYWGTRFSTAQLIGWSVTAARCD